MSDPTTREKVAERIKEKCPLRDVLIEGKDCPHYGPSGTCTDCTWGWLMISKDILKLAEVRRAAYEKEQDKVKLLQASLKDSDRIIDSFFEILGDGLKSFLRAANSKTDDGGGEESTDGQA